MAVPEPFSDPLYSRRQDALRLSYELPHRVYDAKLYPVRSTNGSSIILYGHDQGLTVIWRGGRRLAAVQKGQKGRRKQPPRHTNVISIDSDEDDDQSTEGPFEDEEDEEDPSKPFDAIIATHDIHLNSRVRSVALAPLPSDSIPRDTIPPTFTGRIIVAAACSDRAIELLSLPLDPVTPHQTTKAYGKKKIPNDVHRVEVTASGAHHAIPRGVALSYTNAAPGALVADGNDDEDVEMDETAAKPRGVGDDWQLLVASHSWGALGLLAVSRVQHKTDQGAYSFEKVQVTTETVMLKSAGTSLSFNPARYPSPRHSQLLLADTSGAARLFETAMAKRYADGRRLSSNGTQQLRLHTQLLTTFFAPYALTSSDNFSASRQKLLDVSWVLNGKCILALLGNGTWGIWDYAGAGPQSEQKHKSAGALSTPGTGATQFSIEGRLTRTKRDDATSASAKGGTIKKGTASAPATLAPMTPNTRKTKSESLFSAQTEGLKPSLTVKGKLSVSPRATKDTGDETVIISYGQDFFVLPRLLATWKRTQDGQKANAATPGHTTLHAASLPPVASLSTLGEMVTRISQFPSESSNASNDVLIAAERRLVIWIPIRFQPKPAKQLEGLFSRERQSIDDQEQAVLRVDQDRLQRGDLNLGGIDRMLASMNDGRKRASSTRLESPLAVKPIAGVELRRIQ